MVVRGVVRMYPRAVRVVEHTKSVRGWTQPSWMYQYTPTNRHTL